MFKYIFTPIKINNLEIKNRLVVPSMVTQYCDEDGKANERFIAYHEAKAKGGWGLIMTENYSIEKHVGAFIKLPGLWEDEQIESHKKLTDRIHKYGAKIGCQIYHAGRVAHPDIFIEQPVGPSSIKDPTKKYYPKELNSGEIKNIVESFGDAALRVKKSGFDLVEIHGGHGYLIAQFLSSFSNKRTDQYGGSLYNRCRFMVEVINNIRSKVGEDYPIQLRISTTEDVEDGLDIAQTQVIAQIAQAAGVDSIHASQGNLVARTPLIPPYAVPHAAYANNASSIKSVVSIPVIGVGRINDPLIAETLLTSGKMDLVAMGRASLADPELPNKSMNECIEDIGYCIACMQGCFGQNARGTDGIRCLVNPELGLEYKSLIEQVECKKNVMIAGGGIAGCEAAILAAKKGHDVTLWESGSKLGGQWNAAFMPPGKTEFNTLISWQSTQLHKLGVNVKLNSPVTEDSLINETPDILLISTGSTAIKPNIKGIDGENVVTAYDILMGIIKPGNNVVVVGGGLVGAETADFVAQSQPGSIVSIIEMLPVIAKDGESPNNMILIPNLDKLGVKMYTESICKEIGRDFVSFEKDGNLNTIKDVDQVILAVGMNSNNSLGEIAKKLNIKVLSIGDAASPKNGLKNMWESFDVVTTL